jgi:hypothetical protein
MSTILHSPNTLAWFAQPPTNPSNLSVHVLQLRCEQFTPLLQNMLARIWDRVRFPDEFIAFFFQQGKSTSLPRCHSRLLLGATSLHQLQSRFGQLCRRPTIVTPLYSLRMNAHPLARVEQRHHHVRPLLGAESATMLATQLSAATIGHDSPLS